MRQTNSLGLMFDRFAIHNSVLELLHDSFVDGVTLESGQLVLLCIYVLHLRSLRLCRQWIARQQVQSNLASDP